MTYPSAITEEIQKLSQSAIVEFFDLDTSIFGGPVYHFHAGTNKLNANLVWGGVEYARFPVEAEGFSFVVNSTIPRPTLRVSSLYGYLTGIILANNDMVGTKVTRRRTLVKFLDAINFVGNTNPSADPTAEFEPDIYFIDRKSSENKDMIEFELAASIDLEGVELPFRQIIQNICPWKYRGAECSWAGMEYFDNNDNPTVDVAQDACSKKLSGCKIRFGINEPLPYGGFPSASLIE